MTDLVHAGSIQVNDENNLKDSSLYLPHNVEAEQGLIGALLVNNEVYDKISQLLHSQHFFDPVHQRIYEVAIEKISRNSSSSRQRNRCWMTGRSRGFFRDFGLSRHVLREMGNAGFIPGLKKSSW